jgi:hypothetical protein
MKIGITERGDAALDFHILNLYVDDLRVVLFTQDHIVPVSLGGKSIQDNLQVMCFNCNQKKGNSL